MSTYFDKSEFDCKCGCGTNKAKQALIDKLNVARGNAGIPFVIVSGTRCEARNEDEGGAPDSAHLDGWAADIRAASSRARYKIIKALLDAGFTRIGPGRTFVHADCDPDKSDEVIWLYK